MKHLHFMNETEILQYMSDNNSDSMMTIDEILSYYDSKSIIFILDFYDIKGIKLKKLFEVCCNKKFKVFIATVNLLLEGFYDREAVDYNLNLETPIAFINIYVKSPNKLTNRESEKWHKYALKEKEFFIKHIDHEKSVQKVLKYRN